MLGLVCTLVHNHLRRRCSVAWEQGATSDAEVPALPVELALHGRGMALFPDRGRGRRCGGRMDSVGAAGRVSFDPSGRRR